MEAAWTAMHAPTCCICSRESGHVFVCLRSIAPSHAPGLFVSFECNVPGLLFVSSAPRFFSVAISCLPLKSSLCVVRMVPTFPPPSEPSDTHPTIRLLGCLLSVYDGSC